MDLKIVDEFLWCILVEIQTLAEIRTPYINRLYNYYLKIEINKQSL
jgi:hypothetical protein